MSFSNLDPADLPGIDPATRKDLGDELQSTLVELLDLALVGKQMHWNVTGENFIAVHRLLDEFIEFWYDSSDTVAERAIQLGYSVDGQAVTVGKQGGYLSPGPLEDTDVVRETTTRIKTEADVLRARIAESGPEDVISQNILIGVLEELEKQLWFIRVQLDVDEDEPDENDPEEPNEPAEPPSEASADVIAVERDRPGPWVLPVPRRPAPRRPKVV